MNGLDGQLAEDEVYEITNNYYEYSGKYYEDDVLNMNMDTNSGEYNLLFINSTYWLASKVKVSSYEGGSISNNIIFGLRHISSSNVIAAAGATGTVDSTKARGVRPVIVLDLSADLVLSSDGTSYDIKI